jgi:hypothetical protein
MRVPGSLNTKAPTGYQRVLFFPLADSSGLVSFYTLPEIASRFGVEARKTSLALPRLWRGRVCSGPVDEKVSEARRGACRARWRYALDNFKTLRRLRGSFKLGHRTRAVFIYTILLSKNRTPIKDIREAVIQLSQECNPPLERDKTLSTMQDAFDYKLPIRHDTCVETLGVTTEERPLLTHWCRPARITKAQNIAERRKIIQMEVARLGRIPSASQMASLLELHGVHVTSRTVSYDYRALSLRSDRTAGRPRKTKHLHQIGKSEC